MTGSLRYKGKSGLLLGVITGLLTLFASCNFSGRKQFNHRITLRRNDDNPYGARIAYDGLSWLFPDADISVQTLSPQSLTSGEEKKAVIFVSPSVDVSPSEVNAVINFVSEGNQLFFSAFRYSDTLLHTLGIRSDWRFRFTDAEMDSLTVGVYSPVNADYHLFSYPGDSYDTYISSLDSQYTSVLGRDARGHPNFVRISYKGGGAIYLQFAPLAFSNFFLLHKKNIGYYENALSYIPSSTKQVIWNDYFRYNNHSRRSFSALQYLFSNEALRWAFWLLLLLFALVYIFDSKRRQRMIPAIAPLRNTSLDFVRTIGRLYFQRRDNRNLAGKMAAHFQDQVRTKYRLPVTALDEEFVKRLAYRTGYSRESLQDIVGYIRELPARGHVPDDELIHFHRQLEAFYKHI
ncbi:MAG TPA: hypothetical protein VGM89_17760 [Puia sp.]